LSSLEAIDLSHNLIESVNEMNFNFSKNLSSINLNFNFIKIIHDASFKHLINLKSFKMASNNLESFDMGLLNWNKMLELDLSFNNLFVNGIRYFIDF
jgi:Leucine-rich repeat (LRR) protein